MGIYAEATASVPKIEDGSYYGRCQAMIEIGTVVQTFEGKNPKPAKKVRLVFEICGETYEDADGNVKQRTVAKEFTLSMHEKASLRKFLEAWRTKKFTDDEAKRFDITVLIGKGCVLSIVANEKGYPEIQSAQAPMKGAEVPPLVNPAYELSYEKWDDKLYEAQPEFVRNAMAKTPEYAQLMGIPFVPQETGQPKNANRPPQQPAAQPQMPASQQRMLNQRVGGAAGQGKTASVQQPATRPPQLGVDKKTPATPNVKEKYTAADDARDLPVTNPVNAGDDDNDLPF